MTVPELIDYFYATHSKTELARMVARSALYGERVVLPEKLDYKKKGKPGHPSREEWIAKLGLLKETLIRLYPNVVSIRFLSFETGISDFGLVNLRSNEGFLKTLPEHIREYFQQIIGPSLSPVAPLWRGILDLHNYIMWVGNNRAKLGLYELHASMWWSNKFGNDPKYWAKRNDTEIERLFRPRFVDLLNKAGWPTPEKPLPNIIPAAHCGGGCPVVAAFLSGEGLWHLRGEARRLIDSAFPNPLSWPDAPANVSIESPFKRSTLEVVAKILGVNYYEEVEDEAGGGSALSNPGG